ncbi:phosphoenolpyruvate synthase [Roseateles oligotrophus]|uniref:Phosphoenolpyruvate synthase n=1 Tax=Roseateles oligotrophus TaxID=1769250 RepID=A0ABT2YIN7_9BURK|nr:phosphoenolpyruvate synthase [Roseateles oligotrophus]MCV2369926.1 phosphoenolpyruvate synthase [Roseateles oligotrophus]
MSSTDSQTLNPARSDDLLWFKDIGLGDTALVGGKNASLGELYRELTPQGLRVPNGFAITAAAYRRTLAAAGAGPRLQAALEGLNLADVADLARRAALAREIVYTAELPADLSAAILAAYRRLQDEYGPSLSLAVRSSATAEDLADASFAGQHESYLNISGEAALLEAVKRCFASLYTDRAIAYRTGRGFDHAKVFLSVGVMKMVRADIGAAGVMFTLDTETGFRDVVLITGSYGLGENVVQGAVDPDEFYVHKPSFELGFRAVLRRTLGSKKLKMVYAAGGARDSTRNLPTERAERERYCLEDAEVLTLADCAIRIEKHYTAKAGQARPMDCEWAKDGMDGRLYIVQARPETVASQLRGQVLEQYRLRRSAGQADAASADSVRASGKAVGAKIASGRARVIQNVAALSEFRPGEVLVADITTPDWGTVMKTAAAIVTNRGGRTCHAAIVARELGIPAVVGCDSATRAIRSGDEITVSCAEGDIGHAYAGLLPFEVQRTDLAGLARPATQIMLNIGDPVSAFKQSFLPNDGVGLARMEFIISDAIGIHPMALVHPERISDPLQRAEILRRCAQYPSPSEFFIQRLAEGIGTIAAAFYPKPVVVRLSDFKTHEYASLLGGAAFEPQEANPMLGFRGASRYAHPAYAEGFALECAALKRVREQMGLSNVILMLPFCRRVEEGRQVLQRMAALGLERGVKGLKIYVMCEIPNNVLQLDAFAGLFDGFSIGSNDLTQLTLGVDRDSEIVAFDYDERDEGVKELIRLAVLGCQRNHCHSGICGQAPSDYPEMAEFLVRLGIDSISLNPDSVLKTTLHVLEIERQLGRPPRLAQTQ